MLPARMLVKQNIYLDYEKVSKQHVKLLQRPPPFLKTSTVNAKTMMKTALFLDVSCESPLVVN